MEMYILKNIQMFFLAMEGMVCFFLALFSLLMRQQTPKRKSAIFLLEFAASVILNADLVTYIYTGRTDVSAIWVIKIANFLIYLFLYLELQALNNYLRTFVAKKDGTYPKCLDVAPVISVIGIVPVVISLFNGMYFYVDAEGTYQRGPLFLLSYLAPVLVYLIILSIIVKYRKNFPRLIRFALFSFASLPLITSVIQGIFDSVYAFDISIGIAAIAMFAFCLIDQNSFLLKIASEEKMTGLPNAYGMMSEIGKKIAMRSIAKYNALYFDIVRMGLINRKYGSATGDAVIVNYAQTLRAQMKEDEALGRLGGNYFVALVRKENTEKFLDWLSGTPIQVDTPMGTEVVTISAVAGIYEITEKDIGTITPQQVLTNISMAVNIAKNIQKKPYVFLTPELQKQMDEQRQLLEMIPKCMAQREFLPYYQPKVNTETNTLAGAEALVRWLHDGELVPPVRFVPLMEQNESICKLDFYMLDSVCRDIREWLDKGLTPPVISVNFSRKNLGNKILAEAIHNVVEKYNVPPHLIQIEITETIDEYPLSDLQRVVRELQGYGMSVAIDDFGTGSSSIKLLKEVHFNVLKIDKSFIDSTTERSYKILGYIIAMAKSMDAGVITEGVEHAEQIDILETLGCTEIQGYYFDKPLSKELFEQRLKDPNYSRAQANT